MTTHRAPHWTDGGKTRLGRGSLVLVVALALVLAAAGVATAFFTATGSDTGTLTTGTLAAPTSVSGSQVASTGTVNVSWTASTGSPAPSGYFVQRVPSSGPVVAACGTSAAAPTTGTACSDAGVPVGTSTYVVTAVYRTWSAASAPSSAVNVVTTTQTITFTSSPVSPTYGGTYTVTANGGGSGNPVVFSSATPGVCTVTGSSVSFGHAGTCTINANQAGGGYYTAAPQVQQIFTIAKAAQVVSFDSTAPSAAVVGGPGYTPTATGGGSGNPVVLSIDSSTAGKCSLSGGVVSHDHVGSCTVNANQAGNADYLAANQVQQPYAIGQGSQAISFTSTVPADAKVNGTTYTVAATGGASGNAVTFSSGSPGVCSVAGSTVSFVGAGTCIVNADQAASTDYLAAAQVQQSFAVTRTDQTVSFTSTAPTAATFNGSSYTVAATATSGLAVTFTVSGACTISGTTVSFNNGAGICTINANQAGNAAYNAAPQVQQAFTVGKASQTITFGALGGKTFGDASFTVSATASSGLTVAFSTTTTAVCTVTGTSVAIVGAGTCTIDADQAGNANYNAAPRVSQSFTVAKASQAITFAALAGKTYGDPAFTVSATASSGFAVSFAASPSGVCTISGSTVTIVGAGDCTITASQGGSTNYNAATAVPRTFTVAKATPTVTFGTTAPSSAAAGTTYTPTASASPSGPTVTIGVSGACSIAGGVVTFGPSTGTCTITASSSATGNFNAASATPQSVTVTSAVVAPVITSCSRPSGNNKGYSISWTWAGGTPNGGFKIYYTNLSSGSIAAQSPVTSPWTTPNINGNLSGTFELAAIVNGVEGPRATAAFSHTGNNSDTCTIN
ncbi:beta strand repeat-containing protein [Marmoricola sp. RAF53]|uniref:beta strand repeat-containing protein n=1 Tax=Marmoricola sp. RAF53 TaxID=3233059 RepID=UPI003F9D70BB